MNRISLTFITRLFGTIAVACLAATPHLIFARSATPTPRDPLTPQQATAIDQFIASEMARQRIPGLEVGIYSRGRILLAKGYGLANVELNVPVKPETIFQSGSVGKQFVSAAIMLLVEEGKLSLDDSITKYFLDAPTSWKSILIKNLLSHTSGLSEYTSPDRYGSGGPFYFRLDFTEDELLKKMYAMPIEWAPGERWAYRNTNYAILGFLIHKTTGVPYAQFLHDRVSPPLGMTATRPISEHDIIMNRAAGYQIDDGQLKNQIWLSPTFNSTADGTLYFNVIDLARWDETLYTTRLLTQASLDRIWTVYPLNDGTPNPMNYGFGWVIKPFQGHRMIAHGGENQGFTSLIVRYPDDGLTTVVLTNLSDVDPFIIAKVVAGVVDASLLPPKLTAIADADPSLAASLRNLLDQIVAGTDIRPQSAPELAASITPEASKRNQQRLTALWPGGALTLVQRQAAPDAPKEFKSTFRLSKGTESVLIYYWRNTAGKIAGFALASDRPYE